MPKILTLASYTAEGAKGLLKDGGTKRRAAVEGLITSLGGTLEAFYFAFGENDIVAMSAMPHPLWGGRWHSWRGFKLKQPADPVPAPVSQRPCFSVPPWS